MMCNREQCGNTPHLVVGKFVSWLLSGCKRSFRLLFFTFIFMFAVWAIRLVQSSLPPSGFVRGEGRIDYVVISTLTQCSWRLLCLTCCSGTNIPALCGHFAVGCGSTMGFRKLFCLLTLESSSLDVLGRRGPRNRKVGRRSSRTIPISSRLADGEN